MPRLIARPSVVEAAGNKPKRIEEYAGRAATGHGAVSVARMRSPGGWQEPGQRPEFEEITVVLRGMLRVEHEEVFTESHRLMAEDSGAGAIQAKYMAERLWSGFWFLALLNGFWILFSTHLGNTDTLVRTVTDIIWVESKNRWKTENVGRVYYTVLLLFTAWGLITTQWGTAMTLFQALGVAASLVLALGAIQILFVNTTLLPVELRPPLWIRGGLLVCAGFYAVMFGAVLLR